MVNERRSGRKGKNRQMFYYLTWAVGGLKFCLNRGKIKLRNSIALKRLYVITVNSI